MGCDSNWNQISSSFLDRSTDRIMPSPFNNVLKLVALPYLQQLKPPIFQQDNSSPHTDAVTRDIPRQPNLTLLPEPKRLLDFSPVELVWVIYLAKG